MPYKVVSSDNHIDLTFCPADLWSSQAPAKWKLLVPRVEELEDGLHWRTGRRSAPRAQI